VAERDLRPTETWMWGLELVGCVVVGEGAGTEGPDVLDVAPDFPRDYAEQAALHPAVWSVEDGAIVGRQQPLGSGSGGYLISDEQFGDFELTLELNPDWPADTGIMLRRRSDSWHGLQVLVDHRHSGAIGGLFGNGLGSFHAIPFAEIGLATLTAPNYDADEVAACLGPKGHISLRSP
jgi:hypothetical protein